MTAGSPKRNRFLNYVAGHRGFAVIVAAALIMGAAGLTLFSGKPDEVTDSPGNPIVYAPLPMENPAATVAAGTPLVETIRDRTGLQLEIRHYSGYVTILKEFVDGRIDLAYLGPLPLIALRTMTSEAVPIVTLREVDGTTSYRCVLAIPYDTEAITDTSGPNGTSEPGWIALAQPLSTCGYLSTVWLLSRHGITVQPDDYRYLGSHEAVALAIARRDSVIGGMKDAIAEGYAGLGVRIVDRTEPLPGFAIVANRSTMSQAQIADVRSALLSLTPAELETLDLGHYGFADVDEDAYTRVTDMLSEIDLSFVPGGTAAW
jgi:phosphonate transport system substrate-binding protein